MTDDSEKLRFELEKAIKGGAGTSVIRYALAALGSIPGIGGAISGISAAWSEKDQKEFNKTFAAWMKLQEDEIREIGATLMEILVRLDHEDPRIAERIRGKEFMSLIKKCFRDWSAAESEEKRVMIRNLLVNAGSSTLSTDDVVRQFIDWIDKYSVGHFHVISAIYNENGITRYRIWEKMGYEPAREDSAEADLFKLYIRDLSMGGVIRQHRETDHLGNFLPKERKSRGGGSMKSAFDDEERYELTDLGKQFVHYTMNEIVPKIESASSEES